MGGAGGRVFLSAESRDSLEPSGSAPSAWVSFTLRVWMIGLRQKGGERLLVPDGRSALLF